MITSQVRCKASGQVHQTPNHILAPFSLCCQWRKHFYTLFGRQEVKCQLSTQCQNAMMYSLKAYLIFFFTFFMSITYIKDAYRWFFAFPTNQEKRQNCIVWQANNLVVIRWCWFSQESKPSETPIQSGLLISNSMLVEVLECDSSSLHSSFLLA